MYFATPAHKVTKIPKGFDNIYKHPAVSKWLTVSAEDFKSHPKTLCTYI